MKNVLLYRRGGLGDTLFTFPVLEIFKRLGYRTVAVGNTDYYEIAKHVGFADEVYSELPEGEYEKKIIISLEGNLKPFPEKRIWILEHYLKSLNLPPIYSPTLPIKQNENSPLKGKVVIHPSSGSKKKNPPLELFLSIGDYLKRKNIEYIYLLGEAEEELSDTLKPNFFSLSPLEIARNLKTARFYVGLDSGITHLASYLGIKGIAIYGPTDKVVWKPLGDSVKVLSLDYECSPCFPNVCKERPCLNPEELFNKLVELIELHLIS
ncbi:glycosyltransferase family 9 protein [Aquifex pyrophilus]